MTLPIVVRHAPRVGAERARQLAAEFFGLAGELEALPSERDQNFRLARPDGQAFVLKIANAAESRAVLDLQNAAMTHLASHAPSLATPRVVPALDGCEISEVTGEDGRRHFVRVLTWVPGRVLAEVKPHGEALLEDLGQAAGEMSRALRSFEHAALRREFPWDLAATLRARGEVERVARPGGRALLHAALDRFERDVQPRLGDLPRQAVHNDWNDYNVVVGKPPSPELSFHDARKPSPELDIDDGRKTQFGTGFPGVVDFGDMLYSVAVAEVAVCCAYAMLDKPDPVGAAGAIVRGFHRRRPLKESELEVLFELIRARLVLSVVMAACQQAEAPGNEYLQVSQRQVWALLGKLEAVSPAFALFRFRAACGLPPCPRSAAVASWLAAHRDEFGPVTTANLRGGRVKVLDLSVGSLDISSLAIVRDPAAFSRLVVEWLARAGAEAGIGRYGEPRLLYASDLFHHGHNWAEENRTVHLGIDVFEDAGTTVFAPLAGRVHSFQDNQGEGDYGPTILLEHEAGGLRFWTLYGHLSRASLEGLERGRAVARGDRVGWLGHAGENGGWPPHLHFQVVVDLLGCDGNFPGVAPPSEREVWESVSPDPNLVLGIPADAFPAPPRGREAILASRQAHLGRNLSVSYRKPLTIVRGEGAYLFDAEGRRFLDAVNNVPHVGHSHPRVVAAAARQLAVLDTNTRYLHPALAEYVERLTALFPAPLSVCFLVNSGSEANELAIRLARASTGARGIVVVDGAYHGNTSSLVDISPYKFDGPGGAGCPPHVRVAPMPDVYRGGGDSSVTSARPDVAFSRYVSEAARDLQASEHGLAAFFCESLLSCGGQIVLPEGYLTAAYEAVRAAGGVCVADEVQVGFGRVGTHTWGFETQGVVPDIVTLGKPIGNGFPLGAVVTTPEIAAAFANGMEYFNTFGGSPVACAVGLAVLNVMRDEGLQERALHVGGRLKAGLETLRRFPIVGDVRGLGLFLGVELVRDRRTLEPAAGQAEYVINRLRDRGILASTDGPLHNVIKIKPPLAFSEADADRLVAALADVLGEDAAQPDA